jgi:periplasmic mercuric ion binding protein
MKTKNLSLLTLLLFGVLTVFAGEKTEKFKVYGNCGMCQSRIEKAAKSVDGVTTAEWDKETKILEVTFDDSKTDVDKIELALVEVGHDTENLKAKNSVYDELPGCCHYERAEVK